MLFVKFNEIVVMKCMRLSNYILFLSMIHIYLCFQIRVFFFFFVVVVVVVVVVVIISCLLGIYVIIYLEDTRLIWVWGIL